MLDTSHYFSKFSYHFSLQILHSYFGEGGGVIFHNNLFLLTLQNSKDNGNPVRVIRGHVEKSSYSGKVYTYDGLYKVSCLK